MSNVVLKIGGRDYSMTCATGEEAHIGDLGRMIDAKLGTLRETGGQNANTNDSRSLLFAALLLADELHELRKAAGSPPQLNTAGLSLGADASPERLAAVADRLEALVGKLGIAA